MDGLGVGGAAGDMGSINGCPDFEEDPEEGYDGGDGDGRDCLDDDEEVLGEFECIPLQTVCGGGGGGGGDLDGDPDDDDIYFLDEFGNYVFPVSSAAGSAAGGLGAATSGCCSCRPSAEDGLDSDPSRRVSQVRPDLLRSCKHAVICKYVAKQIMYES